MILLSRQHFQPNPSNARALFASSVSKVEIETSQYCNRVCSYCPNSFIDRRTTKAKMDDALFFSIIRQLGEIDYNGTLCFHRYNEPLSDRADILRRLREASAQLPQADLRIYTNGDYLDRDYLDELIQAGCRSLHATAHIEPADYTDDKAQALLEKRLRLLGHPYTLKRTTAGIEARVHAADQLDFLYQVIDFGRPTDLGMVRLDRGQSIATEHAAQRSAPCTRPFTEMQIETDGTLMPCCNLRGDIPAHLGCSTGRLTPDSDIFAAWTSAHYVKWRSEMATDQPKTGVCATCTDGIDPEWGTARTPWQRLSGSALAHPASVLRYVQRHGLRAAMQRSLDHAASMLRP